jgi:hypothetical protein
MRPFPATQRPDFAILSESYRELADFGEEYGVGLLVENGGWIETDPEAIPRLVQTLPEKVAASPDLGSWAKAVRYDALARAFPYAVTCDFKAGRLGPNGEHPSYDLRRCFEIGWQAGFRGPWCIEHGGAPTAKLFRELRWIRDQLETWMRESE